MLESTFLLLYAENILECAFPYRFTGNARCVSEAQDHTLPVEDHQIRRGGNGQILLRLFSGSTLFRTREYNTIMRLNHSNIVPLLALMVGEVSHRKQFFCYHMLPRMSGMYIYTLAIIKSVDV